MEKLENINLNEMETLNIKQKKQNKLDKRLVQSPVVFKHGCSLETYLQLCRKKKRQYQKTYIFQKISR